MGHFGVAGEPAGQEREAFFEAAFVAVEAGAEDVEVDPGAAAADAEADPRGRIAFMGDAGLVVSVIFLAVIVLGLVAVPSLDACDLG